MPLKPARSLHAHKYWHMFKILSVVFVSALVLALVALYVIRTPVLDHCSTDRMPPPGGLAVNVVEMTRDVLTRTLNVTNSLNSLEMQTHACRHYRSKAVRPDRSSRSHSTSRPPEILLLSGGAYLCKGQRQPLCKFCWTVSAGNFPVLTLLGDSKGIRPVKSSELVCWVVTT